MSEGIWGPLDDSMPSIVTIALVILWVAILGLHIWVFVSGMTSLARRTLSPRARRVDETKLREVAIIRDEERVDASALDELLLNMKHHHGWRFLTGGLWGILIGGVGPVLFVFWLTPGTMSSPVNVWPIFALLFVGLSMGTRIGTVVADMRYAAAAVPETRTEELFVGTGAIMHRPRWLFALNCSLVGVVCALTIQYSLSTPESNAEPIAQTLILRHPWSIWIIPTALCLMILAQELVIRYETHRPALRLTGQPDLASRADVYLRRKGYRSAWESSWLPIPCLAFGQLFMVVIYPVAVPLATLVAVFSVVLLITNQFYEWRRQMNQASGDTASGLTGASE